MIAVTGANGQLGRLTIQALLAKGATDIRALVRTPGKAADLRSDMVDVVEADYDRPDTLRSALTGADRLLLISGSEVGKRVAQHTAVIEAAKAAGVSFIAYTSLLRADTSPMKLAEEHRETEARLAASGIPHALLRNGWYVENYAATIGAALDHGAVVGASGNGLISAAGRQDYAEAAAAVISESDLRTRTYELAGSPSFTLADLAAELSRQSGREIPFVNMSETAYAGVLKQAGLPDGFASILADSDAAAANGALQGTSQDLESLTGHASRSLKDFIATALAG
ncbi:SDR family oxidoreductase [Roseibium sp. CAU 1637]|uniref:SDR family oxidoreductase n=1 Tax=Roseibium limicola TaxID=2816037 RepID=A0A939J4Y7_9HYPH|nr:SDR family oxidoreductase [Roseibium limicola]MBO0345245.1 SDR family oxidoreductase [Roseibium limicola]